jgi:hypothetical protein
MGLLKTVYHSKTDYGGYCKGGDQSHLKPVVRYLFRELLFRTGDGAHYFENIKYPGKVDPFYVPPLSFDQTARPTEEEIRRVTEEWNMEEWCRSRGCTTTLSDSDEDDDDDK